MKVNYEPLKEKVKSPNEFAKFCNAIGRSQSNIKNIINSEDDGIRGSLAFIVKAMVVFDCGFDGIVEIKNENE